MSKLQTFLESKVYVPKEGERCKVYFPEDTPPMWDSVTVENITEEGFSLLFEGEYEDALLYSYDEDVPIIFSLN